MNQQISKGLAAILVMLFVLQAPVALAFSCADHDSKKTASNHTDSSSMLMDEADCHGKLNNSEPQPAANSECCDDCSCPIAMTVGLMSTSVELTIAPSPDLVSSKSLFLITLHPDNILHPPIV
jgi:hypothetical protein